MNMNLGLVFKSGDVVLIGVFLCLVAMSAITWIVAIYRIVKFYQTKKANRVAKTAIWSAHDLNEVENIAKQNISPVSELALYYCNTPF